MKRGFLFSMLIAVMLGLFMLVAQYYILERPTTSVFPGIIGSKESVAYSVASDLKAEMPVDIAALAGLFDFLLFRYIASVIV